MVVNTNKSFWMNYLEEDKTKKSEVKSKVYEEESGRFMSALLVFKKGSYLKLIPYFSKLVDIKKKV